MFALLLQSEVPMHVHTSTYKYVVYFKNNSSFNVQGKLYFWIMFAI